MRKTRGRIIRDTITGMRERLEDGLRKGLRKQLRGRTRKAKEIKNNIKNITFRSGVTIVKLTGNITFDTFNLKSNQDEFSRRVKRKRVKNILFDLKDVREVDTAAIAALVSRLRYLKIRRSRGKIGLINLSPRMRHLLEISKTNELFTEYPSEEEAIDNLK